MRIWADLDVSKLIECNNSVGIKVNIIPVKPSINALAVITVFVYIILLFISFHLIETVNLDTYRINTILLIVNVPWLLFTLAANGLVYEK
jgi:hypothetical protein